MMIKNRLRKTASKRLPEECRTKFKQALKSLFEHYRAIRTLSLCLNNNHRLQSCHNYTFSVTQTNAHKLAYIKKFYEIGRAHV